MKNVTYTYYKKFIKVYVCQNDRGLTKLLEK